MFDKIKGSDVHYKKLDDIPKLPEDLKNDLIDRALQLLGDADKAIIYNKPIETEDSAVVNYLGGEDIDFYNRGGVTAMVLPDDLTARVNEFYKQFNHPIISMFDYLAYFTVRGPEFLPPHQDDPAMRNNGIQLLLKPGGQQVKTAWWQVKEEFKNLPIIPDCCIPYSKLDKVDEAYIEEDYWHFMDVNTIHSVENLESIRIFLIGGKVNCGEYRDVINSVYP